MNLFQQLIWDLGETFNLPLHVDENNTCQLLVEDKLHIQLEMDRSEEKLIIAASLGELPPGRFREDLLKEALKSNAHYNVYGTLSYSEKRNLFILQTFLFGSRYMGAKLAEFLVSFIEYAKLWQQAIESGVPPSSSQISTTDLPPPFSLK